MKKRLLSAALALAMVLTMLPLSIMPAAAAYPTEAKQLTVSNGYQAADPDTNTAAKSLVTVTWRASGYTFRAANASTGVEALTATQDGWYYYGNALSTDTPKENELYYADSGVIAASSTATSGAWYPDVEKALGCRVTSMKLLANTTACDVGAATGTSLTIELNGYTLALSGNLDNTKSVDDGKTTLTSLTITNNAAKSGSDWPAVTGTLSAANQNFTYTATKTGGAGPSISVANGTGDGAATTARTLSVTLTDAVTGALSVQEGAATVRVTASTKDGAKTGAISVNGTTSSLKNINYGTTTISVSGGKVDGAITLNGKGTITLTDMAETGAITLYGGKKGDSGAAATAMPTWGGSTTVNVGSQCVTGKISVATGNEASMTVNVTGGSGSTTGVSEIDLTDSSATTDSTAHTVKVDGSKTGAIKLNAGTLTISNGADTGTVTIGEGGKTTATISGDATKVTSVAAAGSKDVTLNISGGEFGTGGVTLPDGYAKHTITGGTFGKAITEAGWLGSVNYQIKANSKFTYTSSFQACVDAYKNFTTGDEITVMGVETANKTVRFFLDAPAKDTYADTDAVVIIKTDANHGITLPDRINNKTVTTWYIGSGNTPMNAGALMNFTESSTDVKATTSAADNSNIVAVKIHEDDTNGGLSASLVGNTIQVSGALSATASGFMPIILEVETAIGQKYKVTVSYAVTEKKLVAGAQDAPFDQGGDNASLQIRSTSLIYPLDGSRIVLSAGDIADVDLENGTAVGTVSVSLGTAERDKLKGELDQITVDFSGSPAVQEAVNKVIAGLTQTQVDSYIRQGRIAAYKDINNVTTTPNENQINSVSDYNKLNVVVYLNIQATAWNKTVGQQSMTLNITPYYRLDVTTASGTGMTDGEDYYTVKAGATLSMNGLTSDYGDVEINLSALIGNGKSLADADWAHHGNYVYRVNDSSYKFTTSHGFSPFVLSMTDPVAIVLPDGKTADADARGFYDNVQTAIDDTEEGDTVKLYTTYSKTAETYTISGKARTIIFSPGSNGTFTPTFSGANVVSETTNGNTWKVQLNADTVAATARISVNSASNGGATVNVSNAAAGSTVTITTTANSGYRALTPTVRTNTGTAVAVSGSNGTYTFTVPTGATSISVTPAFEVSTGLPFTDVAATAWYYDGVSYCYSTTVNGYRLLEGTGSTTYAPNSGLTRAEVVQILYNLEGRPAVGTARYSFTDVPSNQWYYNAVMWGANMGYVEGYGDGTFQPNRNVSRQELAVFLHRYANKPIVSTSLAGYSDGQGVATWAQDAMRWAVGYSILSGTNSVSLNGTLNAYSTAYRSQVAVTLWRFHNYYG